MHGHTLVLDALRNAALDYLAPFDEGDVSLLLEVEQEVVVMNLLDILLEIIYLLVELLLTHGLELFDLGEVVDVPGVMIVALEVLWYRSELDA